MPIGRGRAAPGHARASSRQTLAGAFILRILEVVLVMNVRVSKARRL